MDPSASSTASIYDAYHHQVGQYGPELISFVSAELGRPPLGLSITLETIEWPESQVNHFWSVGSAELATERAVLRFFHTDAGKRALCADTVEFKLASALLRLPGIQTDLTTAAAQHQDGQGFVVASESTSTSWPQAPSHPEVPAATIGDLPTGCIAAAGPLQDGQEVVIASESASLPVSHTCFPAATDGWLQVSPQEHFSKVLLARPRDQQVRDAGLEYLGGWLVDNTDRSTVYGRVGAIVGNRGYLVTPLGSHAT
ncbi:hypothetical protein N658DRAFT_338571 [Parathielavia hyrcaniae]|uniref:Uncharacterized protein n=1 Tax=Parathielavia hyrcaniae TaxID=113614 RepID=A0AAN6Q2M5_9PEZI|nr:hypothetical protein N658DRAFT_338571 [Parathielavia hyrcaniae]